MLNRVCSVGRKQRAELAMESAGSCVISSVSQAAQNVSSISVRETMAKIEFEAPMSG